MKRLFALALILMLCAGAIAEDKTFPQTTKEMIETFDSMMYAFWRLNGVKSYSISLTAENESKRSFIEIINDECALNVYQANGHPTKLQVISHDITARTDINQIIAGFCALLAATNFEYLGGSVTTDDMLSTIMADNLPHTINGVTYTYTDTRPLFKIVSLTAEPAQ